MSDRMRTTGYQSVTTKIVAMVAIFAIVVALGVMVIYRANETINTPDSEYLWFEVEPIEAGFDITGDVFIYDENGTLLEHFMLLNETGWQCGDQLYDVRTYVRIYITFWAFDDKVNNVMYLIGRSPVQISLDNMIITLVSDWESPTF